VEAPGRALGQASSEGLDRSYANGWELGPEGTFERLHPKEGEEYVDSQGILLEEGF
jgi:hypothetical protein